ncbi:hypothetical protein F5Y15DRAFT_419367 [Xylariaceae sp. FL0016]|nr:hypothetical protein F5Y15DRAFT_419367 [Xylariaceae sp. FL0016]
MAHSPLFRTLMRGTLDNRGASLAQYETRLEAICLDRHALPYPKTFDADRWADARRAHEDRQERADQRKGAEAGFLREIHARDRRVRQRGDRVGVHGQKMQKMAERVVSAKSKAQIALALARTGFVEWRPRTLGDCLRGEYVRAASGCGTPGRAAEEGSLDRRGLHRYLTPAFLPRPHLVRERRRLRGKSAAFAAFYGAQASRRDGERLLLAGSGTRMDERGIVDISATDTESEDERMDPENKRRKRSSEGDKMRTKKPTPFVRLFDAAVHDQMQLESQTRNRLTLLQQRLPRVEVPTLEHPFRRTQRYKKCATASETTEVDEERDLVAESFKRNGIRLPFEFFDDNVPEEERYTLEQAQEYRKWRRARTQRQFFLERDRYMRNRVYFERAPDREIICGVSSLVGFWAAREATEDLKKLNIGKK